jgi:hypothetical protein
MAAILRHGRGAPGGVPRRRLSREVPVVSPALGWALAVAAIAAGYLGYGWPGVVLAITVIVFWLLLQFSRALRVMKAAAGRPVGYVASAVMLQSRLHDGMLLAQVMKLTGSFGLRRSEVGVEPEVFAWADSSGDEVVVELRGGKVRGWRLQRGAAGADLPSAAGADVPSAAGADVPGGTP